MMQVWQSDNKMLVESLRISLTSLKKYGFYHFYKLFKRIVFLLLLKVSNRYLQAVREQGR